MALVHRSDDLVSPAIRHSNNLAAKLRAERVKADAIARFQQNLINAEIKTEPKGLTDDTSKPSPD